MGREFKEKNVFRVKSAKELWSFSEAEASAGIKTQ